MSLRRPDARYVLALAAPVLPAALGAAACFRARRRTGVRHWGLLGAGLAIYAAACAAGARAHSSPVAPASWLALAGGCFTLGTAVLITAILRFAGARPEADRPLPLADAALVTASSLALFWAVLLGPIATVQPLPNHIVGFVYVYLVEDTLLAMAAVVLVVHRGGRCWPYSSAARVATMALCLGCGDLLDCCAIRMEWGGGFTLAGAAWCIGVYLAIGAAGAAVRPAGEAAKRLPAHAEPGASFAATAFTLGATLMLLLCEAAAFGKVGPRGLGVAGALLGAYLVRHWALMAQTHRLLRENQTFSTRLRGLHAELETTVARRTRYLKALHAITAETKATLNEGQALRLCLTGTAEAIDADCGCVTVGSSAEPSAVYGDEAMCRDLVRRITAWSAAGAADPPLSEPGLHVLVSAAGQQPPALLAVARRTRPFSGEEKALIDSVGLELESAIHNARLHEAAAAAADRDPLTGLLNHRAMQNRLGAEINRCRREERAMAVMMLDLNDFKAFNDTFGHPAGDGVLRRVADTLVACTRDFDLAARYGGDEFTLGLPGADRAKAEEIAERIRRSLAETGFAHGAQTAPLRISYGIAVCPDDATDRKGLLAVADADLYRAKRRRGAPKEGSENLRAGLGGMPAFGLLDSLVSAVDERDRYSRRHAEDVALCALSIARQLGWTEEELRRVRIAALMHDVGKVAVPAHLLRKPGELSTDERTAVQRHSTTGHLLALSLQAGPEVEAGILHHHERWDGHGYPEGLAGTAIPALARLLAVADAYCAMTAQQPQRHAMAPAEALTALRSGAGAQWDPQMVSAFERAQAEPEAVASAC